MNNENQNITNNQPVVAPQAPNPTVNTATPPTPNPEKPTLAEPMGNQLEQGVNLIPSLTKEEKIHVKKKNTLNIGSLLSIIVLAMITIGIVSFNIITKTQLNSRKSALARIEKACNSQIDKIISNNVILTRIDLYQNVRENSFSHKKIIEFLNQMAGRVSGVSYNSINISDNLDFEISGKAPDLEQLSRLWYILGVNENVQEVNLSSVSKGEEGATFSFEGVFILENFKNE